MKREYMKNQDFNGTFPFEPRFKKINGFDMHYVDEGEGDESLVCLHGMPTWSYLYRKFIENLRQDFRIVVPDHMGFGKSDVPQDKQYTMAEHVDNLTKLMISLDLQNITLIVQDWGGPIGLGFAVDHPDRIKRLVIMNTSVGVAREGTKPWYQNLEESGEYDAFFSNLKETIPKLFKFSIYNQDAITDEMLAAYTAPFPTRESCLGALVFPRGIPIGFNHHNAQAMQHVREKLDLFIDTPKIMIWGMQDPVFPPPVIKRWNKKLFPGIQVNKLKNASHFLQEDAPREIISLIRTFINNNP